MLCLKSLPYQALHCDVKRNLEEEGGAGIPLVYAQTRIAVCHVRVLVGWFTVVQQYQAAWAAEQVETQRSSSIRHKWLVSCVLPCTLRVFFPGLAGLHVLVQYYDGAEDTG